MKHLKYKDFTDEELNAEFHRIEKIFETTDLSRKEYNDLQRDYEDLKKEFRSRGIYINF